MQKRMHNRTYKDTLFRWIFGRMTEESKRWRLELYNALNNSDYKNPDELEVTTIENVIYLSMKNDLSFLVDSKMTLYEQQSTYNPNMPLRGFLYFSQLYEKWLAKEGLDLYGHSLIKIPTPNYVVFYNGERKLEDITKFRLSDAFIIPEKSKDFEWTATFVNINEGHNDSINKKCKPLYDYNRFVSRVKKNLRNEMKNNEAVSEAVEWAISENLLEGFFKEQKAEAVKMILTEFDPELYEKNRKHEAYEEGRAEKAIEAAENLLKLKVLTLEQIAQAEGLPLEKVLELAEKVKG
ncbi:MAG: hypothetical protein K5786_03495 [Treponema sp.]|nr:hypothetical protein [Treponema sp.]